MRILLISDIHANPWALHAVELNAGPVDQILCAGDTVNYGPRPGPILDWLRRLDAVTVRGNHDNAVAFAVDPKASPAKQLLALAMRDWTRQQLDATDLGWLLSLERRATCQYAGCRFVLVHGTSLDPLYDYRLTPNASEGLLDELTQGVKADVLLVGHTHLPLLRKHRELTIVNPGSVGQPLDGDPRAAYAVWDDGEITLRRAEYDRTTVIDALARLPLNHKLIEDLQNTLSRGSIA
jgi:putative phosphoesterase